MFETSWKRTDGKSLLRPFKTSPQRSNKMSRRRTTETSWRCSNEKLLGVSFGTYLRRHWNVQRDVVTMSPRRLFAGWVMRYIEIKTHYVRIHYKKTSSGIHRFFHFVCIVPLMKDAPSCITLLKSDSHLPKRFFSFPSMIVLQK